MNDEEMLGGLPFSLDPKGYRYRPLQLFDGGWDVYALQTALHSAGHSLVRDGRFESQTDRAVRLWQEGKSLWVDGIAGIITQRSLALTLGTPYRDKYGLPFKVLMGMFEKESGYLLGNHPAQYDDESWDLGLTQLNNEQKGVSFEQAFDVSFAIGYLSKNIRTMFDRYSIPSSERTKLLNERGLDPPSRGRRWALAAGSWNRPAYTAWLAGEANANSKKPTADQLAWIQGYMARVMVYANEYYRSRAWPT